MGGFKAQARALAGGLELELSVAVDVMFPIKTLADAVSAFHAEFPDTPLRLYVEALGAVLMPILDGRCSFGVMNSLPVVPPGIGWSAYSTSRWLSLPLPAIPWLP